MVIKNLYISQKKKTTITCHESLIYQYHIILAIRHAILGRLSSKWAQNVRIFKGYHKPVATSSNWLSCMQLHVVFHFRKAWTVLQFSLMFPHGDHDAISWSYLSSTMLTPHNLHTYALCLSHVYHMFYMLMPHGFIRKIQEVLSRT